MDNFCGILPIPLFLGYGNFRHDDGAYDGDTAPSEAVAPPDEAGGPRSGAAPEAPGYVVGRELGRGGSASVWLVREERTLREFALKCFEPPDDPTPLVPVSARARPLMPDYGGPVTGRQVSEDNVRRELRILSVLDHDHLVKAHDVVRLGGSSRRAARAWSWTTRPADPWPNS